MASKNNRRQKNRMVSGWRQMMTSLYPDLHSSTICVPPVIVNKVPYTRDTVAGQPVLVVQQPSDTLPTVLSTPPPPATSSMGIPVTSKSLPPAVEACVTRFFSFAVSNIVNHVSGGDTSFSSTYLNQTYDLTPQTTSTSSVDEASTTALGAREADSSQDAGGSARQSRSPNQLQNGSPNQSQNGSPNQPQNGSPNQSQNGSLNSQNGSPNQTQNGSPNQPQNGSPNQSQNGSPNQSQNGSPNQPQNGSPNQSQNGSPNQSQNGSPNQPQNGSPNQSQNGSPNQPQNGSPNQSQNGSPNQSQNGSPNQSQNGSPNQSQNGSPNQPQNGSPNQSQNGSPNQPQNGSPNQPQNGSPNQSQNGSPNQSQNGSPNQSQNGSPNQSQNGSPNQPQNGSPNQPENGSPNQPQNGSPNQPQNGSPNQPQNGSPNQPQNGSPNQPQNGSPNQPQNGSPNQSRNGSPNQPQNGSPNQPQNGSPNQPQTPSSFSMWTEEPSPHGELRSEVSSSDVRSDFAQQYLLTNLQTLGNARHEIMFVLSQLDFKSYLQDLSQRESRLFPRPVNLAQTGDFDILVIHRHYGVLIGEIKSVGMMHAQLNTAQGKRDADVKERVLKAVKQLDKSEQVVRHLMSDLAPGLMVRKTVMLPFVASAHLLSILSSDPGLNQALCRCLGAANETEVARLCVCSDHLSDPLTPWRVTQADLSHLSSWWQHRMACTTDNSLTDHLYLDIVARFAEPATSVTVECSVPPRLQILRTQGDAVSLLGDTFARLILTPQQVDLLNRAPRRVYLKGPPGTGKTVTLVLMGLRWVLEGHDVYVCSQSYETRAVAELICHQIERTAALHVKSAASSTSTVGKVHLLAYDLTSNDWEEIKKLMLDLAQLACKGGPLRLIFDEIMLGKGSALIDLWYLNPVMMNLELFLKQHYVWMAGVTSHATPPSVEDATFTIPLRCAPAIQREVQAGLEQWAQCGATARYLTHGIPAPSDGLSVTRLLHHGAGHSGNWPVDCEQCGRTIADLLQRQLHVGRPSASHGGSTTSQDVARPAPLRYKDVFIVTRSSDLRDDVTDDAGQVLTTASGVVRGLRQAGVPLYVLDVSAPMKSRKKCQGVVSGMGLMSFDRVVVSFSTFLQGLERKVVVWLPGENRRQAEEYMVESSEVLDRVHALSRCTTQLVMVHLPQPREPDLD